MAAGRERGAVFLIASVLGAFLVTVMIYRIVQDARNRIPAQKPEESSEVVVASRNIPPGVTISATHLQTRELPDAFIPAEVYRTPEEVIGRVAMERILYGEFIREERLADPEAGVGLTAIIPRGMRGFQVKLRGGQQLSGFLNPGNFVDIIAVCAEAEPPEVRTILQSVTVLAVNDRMVDTTYEEDDAGGSRGRKRKSKPSVTLALEPSDAQRVKHASGECDLSLTLRNDIDVTNIDSNDRGPDAGPLGPSLDIEVDAEAEEGQTGSLSPRQLDATDPALTLPPTIAPRTPASDRG
jgi:pilus assembly protein CpaB